MSRLVPYFLLQDKSTNLNEIFAKLTLSHTSHDSSERKRWSHVTFMVRNEHHSRDRVVFLSFAPVVLYFIIPFQFSFVACMLFYYYFFFALWFFLVNSFLVTPLLVALLLVLVWTSRYDDGKPLRQQRKNGKNWVEVAGLARILDCYAARKTATSKHKHSP